jgi:hypothetical protein
MSCKSERSEGLEFSPVKKLANPISTNKPGMVALPCQLGRGIGSKLDRLKKCETLFEKKKSKNWVQT